jgi:tetratricopeptide (TPR) repeat protein
VSSDPHDAEHEIRSILLRAESLLEINRPGEALPLLQDVLRLEPGNLHALAGIARGYLALGDTANALKFSEAAIQAEPEHEWGHRLRSIVLLQRGNKREALAAARRASELAPDNVLVLTQLFSALRTLKKKDEARKVAKHLVEIAPNYSASHINLGLVYLDDSWLDHAEAAFRRALQLDPENWAAMNNIGAVLQRKGRHSESLELYYRAAQLNPALPLPRNNLFRAAKRYVTGRTTAIAMVLLMGSTVALRAFDVSDELANYILPCAILLAFGVGILERRLRLRKLHDPLQRVLADEHRRERRHNMQRFLKLCLVIVLFVVVWLVVWWWYTRGPGL